MSIGYLLKETRLRETWLLALKFFFKESVSMTFIICRALYKALKIYRGSPEPLDELRVDF